MGAFVRALTFRASRSFGELNKTAETQRTLRLRRDLNLTSELHSFFEVEYLSANTILQDQHVEVYQQPDLPSSNFEIGQQLCLMNWGQCFNTLRFNNDSVRNNEIWLVHLIEPQSFVFKWKRPAVL